MIPVPPPPAHKMLAGSKLIAGRGVSTILADMDFETFSEAGYDIQLDGKLKALPGLSSQVRGIKAVGAAAYSEHESTEVLTLYYDLKDGVGPRFWTPGMDNPEELLNYGGLIEAHNSGFEYFIWLNTCVRRYGWPTPRSTQFRCSMAKARAWCLPPSLGDAGAALDLDIRKNADGDRLLKKFSMPRMPTKKDSRRRILGTEDPQDYEKLAAYNRRDIEAEAELSAAVPDMHPADMDFYLADQAINQRGVMLDGEGIENCASVIEQAFEQYNAELRELTGGEVPEASKLARMIDWLRGLGVHTYSLDEESIDALLKTDLPPVARRVLEIRQAIGSASVKKLYSMRARQCRDGRARDLFGFHAARTGRSNGNGPQPTNMPSSGPETNCCKDCGRHSVGAVCKWCGSTDIKTGIEWNADAAKDALEVMKARYLPLAEYYFGDAVSAVSGCLRGLYVSAPGHDLISSDYSAIEAVVLAALAGEEWRMEVFRTHGKIYEMSAAKITGIPFEEFMSAAGYHDLTVPEWWTAPMTGKHHPQRKKIGKVAELASGYGGWIGAWKNFGADAFMTDDEIKKGILGWRKASPAIVEFWGGQDRGMPWHSDYRFEMYGVEGAAVQAILNPDTEYAVGAIRYLMHGDVLYCILPSGRDIPYHRPRLYPSSRREGTFAVSYMGHNTNPQMGPMGWVKMETYAGKLVENIIQAVACDILRYAIINLEASGYPVVLHVYDEATSEVPEGFGSIEEFERIMGTLPPWASGWPIRAAGGWRGKRYRK